MQANPFLGVLFHATGGLAASSFYLPFKRVRKWSWETYWITGGIFSWLIAPILFGLLVVSAVYHVPLISIFRQSPTGALLAAFGFGALWGIGGLAFGLSMRYLGIALGYAIALGFCAAFGTLMPPIFNHQASALLHSASGLVVFGGVTLCMLGIAFNGAAGMNKERELSNEQKKASVEDFNFSKGLVIAIVCGLLSACMAFALAAGGPITDRAIASGTPPLWAGLPTLIIILLGGLASNAIWCVALLSKNRSFGEFVGRDKASRESLLNNYLFCAISGITWYLQFFFYTMGSSQMGARFGFSSWMLHMASIIIFSTLWGIYLKEWAGTGSRTRILVATGLIVLIVSIIVIGMGSYLSSKV